MRLNAELSMLNSPISDLLGIFWFKSPSLIFSEAIISWLTGFDTWVAKFNPTQIAAKRSNNETNAKIRANVI